MDVFKRWFGRGGEGADPRAREQGSGGSPTTVPPTPLEPTDAPAPTVSGAALPAGTEVVGTPSDEIAPPSPLAAAPTPAGGQETVLDAQGAQENGQLPVAPDNAVDPAPVADTPTPADPLEEATPVPAPEPTAEPAPAVAAAPPSGPAPESAPEPAPGQTTDESPAADISAPAETAPVETPADGASPIEQAPIVETPARNDPAAGQAPEAAADAPPAMEQQAEAGQAVEAPTADEQEDITGQLELSDGVQAPLARGTVVAERYIIREPLSIEQAAALLGTAVTADEGDLYAVEDRLAHERCWSCGSTGNGATQRFCVDCGAQLGRQVVLARTGTPSGAAEEVEDHDAYFHPVAPRKQFGRTGITLEIGAFSAEGPHHPNEDSYWTAMAGGCYDSVSTMIGVAALADGMGGYAPGSGLISKVIVGTVGRSIFNLLPEESESEMQTEELEAMVKAAIAQANGKVLDEIRQHGEMGATLVTAVVCGGTAYIANIGDSRAYYIAPSGAVTQISRDQSLIEQQIAAGLLNPDAVYTAFGNNVILHAIGEENVEESFDWYEQPLEPGSKLLLCSDGYWKTMQHDVWDVELATRQPSLRALAQAMVESALARESDDNTTVLLIGIE